MFFASGYKLLTTTIAHMYSGDWIENDKSERDKLSFNLDTVAPFKKRMVTAETNTGVFAHTYYIVYIVFATTVYNNNVLYRCGRAGNRKPSTSSQGTGRVCNKGWKGRVQVDQVRLSDNPSL